jgi:polysaccharide chain length determinant protein (PEP-CTERM system associated)
MENPKNYFLKPEILIEIALRRRWFLILPFCLAMLVGIVLVVVLPKTYTAKTLILVQPQRVPNTYVQSIVTDELSDRIRTISDQILSRTNLQKVITDFGLFKDEASASMLLDDQIDSLRKRIGINLSNTGRSGTASFTISFRGSDPSLVARITNALARYFIDENLKVREAQAMGTSSFLQDELVAIRQRLEQAESKMKEYRESNMGALPEQLDSNLRILERLQAQLESARLRLNDSRVRLAGFQKQRESTPALPVATEGATVGNSMDPNQLRAELQQLLNRYTRQHPDVIRLEKIIADLEAEASAASPAAQGPMAGSGAPIGGLSGHQQQVAETRREISLLENEILKLQSQIEVYEKRVEDTPKREQELLSLRRDYQNTQAIYNSLLARKLEAELSVNLERKQKGEQFNVVDPAAVPERPSDPDMAKLFLMVVVGGLGIGCGLIFLLEYFDHSFRLPEEAEGFLGLSVLGTIPAIYSRADKTRQMVNNISSGAFVFMAGGLFLVFGVLTVKGVDSTLNFVKKFIPL